MFELNATLDVSRNVLVARVVYLDSISTAGSGSGSGMANVIIKLPSGFSFREASLDDLKRTGQINMYEFHQDKASNSNLVLYFENINKQIIIKLDLIDEADAKEENSKSLFRRIENRRKGLIAVFDFYDSIGELSKFFLFFFFKENSFNSKFLIFKKKEPNIKKLNSDKC